MGLAPYGRPVYADLIRRELIDLRSDGSFRLNLRYFDFCEGLRMVNGRFEALFGGPARHPESNLEQRHMDLAASIQAVLEDIVLRIVGEVHRRTGMEQLVLAGGVALNCVANGRILREGPFEHVFVQPAAGDAGGALGAAQLVAHGLHGEPRSAPPSPPTKLDDFWQPRAAPGGGSPMSESFLTRSHDTLPRAGLSDGFRVGWSLAPGLSEPEASLQIQETRPPRRP